MPTLLVNVLAVAGLAVLAVSCASREANSALPGVETPISSRAEVSVPGFESLGFPRARSRTDVLARFGSPENEENLMDGRYFILSYPVKGWKEDLLILFAGQELLGFARESSRAVLESTLQHHARSADGGIVIFQSWFEGKTTYFRASHEQLEKTPRRKSGSAPPMPEAKALELATGWLKRARPGSIVQPFIQGLYEVPRLAGCVFYVVRVFDEQANSRNNLVILMDGTIITGEAD